MTLPNISPEQIESMIKLLQAMLPTSKEASETGSVDDENEDIHHKSPIRTKETKVKKSSKKENLFNKMAEKNKHKEDIEIDKILNVKPPVPRNRHFNLVQVTCRVCGKQESVPASLVQDRSRHKCNRCCASPG
jgi:hypothetical protein